MTSAPEKSPLTALRHQAVKLLARRDHSRQELARKLARYGEPPLIETVLDELQGKGLLSDARFADSWVRANGERFGLARLRQTLRTKGVSGELADARLAEAALPDEQERARQVWARKFTDAPADAREWARQARFLQSRGFATDIIRRVLKDAEAFTDDDSSWPA